MYAVFRMLTAAVVAWAVVGCGANQPPTTTAAPAKPVVITPVPVTFLQFRDGTFGVSSVATTRSITPGTYTTEGEGSRMLMCGYTVYDPNGVIKAVDFFQAGSPRSFTVALGDTVRVDNGCEWHS